jgi:hypothetical protein
MGDRKRTLDSGSMGVPKKLAADYYQATAGYSAEPEKYLLQMQNRAMHVRLAEQKQEIARLERHSETMAQRIDESHERLSLLSTLWNQLEIDLRQLLLRIGGDAVASQSEQMEEGALTLLQVMLQPPSIDLRISPELERQRASIASGLAAIAQRIDTECARRDQALAALRADEAGMCKMVFSNLRIGSEVGFFRNCAARCRSACVGSIAFAARTTGCSR